MYGTKDFTNENGWEYVNIGLFPSQNRIVDPCQNFPFPFRPVLCQELDWFRSSKLISALMINDVSP